MPRALPRDASAPIMLPLCEATNSPPTGRSGSAKAALAVSTIRWCRFTRPRLLGPSSRVPDPWTSACSRACFAAPAAPASPKPPASTVMAGMPRRTPSATASTAPSVGSSTKAWSGRSGRSPRLGQAGSPPTVERRATG